jgi:uncharacterized integral membrane protein
MRSALVVSLILAILAVIFATYNGGEMEVVIPFTDSQIVAQKPIVLISTLLMGVVIGLLASLPGRIGATLRARRAEKDLIALRGGAPAAAAPSAAPTDARVAASQARSAASDASVEAAETQRLADEVARRTASIDDPNRRPS